ncbi:glycoside hydrolase family 5 protein [Bryobacter aggregatus]|uniref:glycoside hydrolase family 5 protein n=1 Tax=Bryobacter aggregatus TaxID=360054 RepID=UPI0004E1C258|nr:cellulase family glycosylhydrolase [Bryobacter aggregatus]
MLAPLATSGRSIVDAGTGLPVLLRGVNVSGMEYSPYAYAGMNPDELRLVVEGWGSNIVRIPFVQSLVVAGTGSRDYIGELKTIVQWLADLGAYTILDLQWLDQETVVGPGENRVPPEPTNSSIACWDILAREFHGVPHVIFDLFNEPHGIPASRWVDWAYVLAGAVRSVEESRVLMVGGLDWAYDLRGVVLSLPNLIYSTHVYRVKGKDWDGAFGDRAREVPVFAGEWGGGDDDLRWGSKLAHYFEEREMGWTAWSWRDFPHLQQDGVATRFGSLVRSLLLRPGNLLTP